MSPFLWGVVLMAGLSGTGLAVALVLRPGRVEECGAPEREALLRQEARQLIAELDERHDQERGTT